MAYSEDYRRRTIEYRRKGHTLAEVQDAFKVYPTTIRAWEARETAGNLKVVYPKTRKHRKFPPDELVKYVDKHPDAFLVEIGAHFGCSDEAVRKALKKLGYTREKNV